MNKIEKLLKKINQKDALRIAQILIKLQNNELKELNIKKLKGFTDIYRIRIGEYRVIYKNDGKNIMILELSKRNDETYKNY